MKSPITWFKDLSKVGKTAVIIVGLTAAGAAASPNTPTPSSTADHPKVEAAQSVVTTENVTATEEIPYQNVNQDDSSLPKGTTKVTTLGVNGTKTLIYRVTKQDGVETKRELVSSLVTAEPVNQISSVGTYEAPKPETRSDCNPNYSPCIPNSPYDLDCADIGFTVRVIGYDVYRLDRDKDGYGCE